MVICCWAAWASGRTALARILVKYGTNVGTAAPLDNAIRLAPADAESHYMRAMLSSYLDQPADALGELELAVSLRPRDYALWLNLGMTRDQLDDQSGALLALNESVRLAPYYSEPRWQRGNLLFRLSRYDEAFADLRGAANSNPGLLPNLIDLAWGTSGHNAALTEQIVQAQTSSSHLALALYFARRGEPAKALSNFAQAKDVTVEKRRELVRNLAESGAFAEAFAVWRNSTVPAGGADVAVFDGSFEGPVSVEDTGFGWRAERGLANLTLSQDPKSPQTDAHSLRIDFKGISNPDSPILTQLLPVAPAAHYKLSFAVRTTNIISGGLPKVVIKDPRQGMTAIANSIPLPANSGAWQLINLEFRTGAATRAIVISVERERCSDSPCPIFGSLNLDSFSLTRVAVP